MLVFHRSKHTQQYKSAVPTISHPLSFIVYNPRLSTYYVRSRPNHHLKDARSGRLASLWQVPWGKHNPVEWRGEHFAPSGKGKPACF